MPDTEITAGRAAMPDRDAEHAQALAEVAAQRRRVDRLADALTSCIVRLEDLNEGDGPTAQHARQVLRSIGR